MQRTEKYFEQDAFRTGCESVILAAEPDEKTGGGRIALDGTVFYPVSMFPMAKEQREISVNTSTIHHFEIIFDNPDFSRLFVPFSHDTLHI